MINFSSFPQILLNVQLTLTIRQCMFRRRIGTERSVLPELCHFVISTVRMFSIVLIVHSLGLSGYPVNTLQERDLPFDCSSSCSLLSITFVTY